MNKDKNCKNPSCFSLLCNNQIGGPRDAMDKNKKNLIKKKKGSRDTYVFKEIREI